MCVNYFFNIRLLFSATVNTFINIEDGRFVFEPTPVAIERIEAGSVLGEKLSIRLKQILTFN